MTITPEHTRRLRSALFVDFDNVYIGLARLDPQAAEAFATDPAHWLSELGQGSDVDGDLTRRFLVRACYLNPSVYSRFRPNFTRAGFKVVDCPSLTQQGKSSADINLVLDAVDALAATTHYDEFVIVSADADFTPLAQRCRADDRRVTIITASPAASAYRSVADTVIGADALADLVTQTASTFVADPVPEPVAVETETVVVEPVAAAAPPEAAPATTRTGRSRRATRGVTAAAPAAAEVAPEVPAEVAAEEAPPAAPRTTKVRVTERIVDEAEARARRAVRRAVRTADAPLPLGAAAQVAQTADPSLAASQWAGTGGFTAWLSRALPDLDVSTRPPGHVWDPQRFGEADLPGAVADTAPNELQRQVIAVTDTPGLSQAQYRVVLQTLAADVAAHPFDRVTTSRRVHEACQQSGAKVGRSTINFVISGVLYTGLSLDAKPTPEEVARSWADNVIGLCRGARMELTNGDAAAIRAWVGGGLVAG
ncbi:NYN domain-containing protein [Cellulomonas sp. Sa3CUA2]|uniref:NYN domain-containing protein n=1 Tax=Cellulomonas avistercoris TaxID=2762242 RepID=A0ABR8QBB1_9CELL|nr:NYN domain-containing protein [Cellulomonas avistercoris]MBD7917719.1 NYN domain-containing protein [Cellulomonas avistercoris]